MGTGFRGTFVISWSQTEVDGLDAAPVQALRVGAAWSWRGDLVQVNGPASVLRLDRADGAEALRRRAARMVQRLVGAALDRVPTEAVIDEDEVAPAIRDSSFVVTDGARSFTVTLIETGSGARPLLMFLDDVPPRERELWVVHHTLHPLEADHGSPHAGGGVICFTPGTRIDTPDGPRLIEDLREGDRVSTKDNGAQEIQWIGSRQMTGARLFAMPHLRPVRIGMGALGIDKPEAELLVSPEHRLLIKGAVARDLFNTPEILVAAKDLINGSTITADVQLPKVTYIHVMLPRHEVLRANGIETESFHPANTALSTLDETDRRRLLDRFPDLEYDPHIYGGYARRNLTASEAAILRHAA